MVGLDWIGRLIHLADRSRGPADRRSQEGLRAQDIPVPQNGYAEGPRHAVWVCPHCKGKHTDFELEAG